LIIKWLQVCSPFLSRNCYQRALKNPFQNFRFYFFGFFDWGTGGFVRLLFTSSGFSARLRLFFFANRAHLSHQWFLFLQERCPWKLSRSMSWSSTCSSLRPKVCRRNSILSMISKLIGGGGRLFRLGSCRCLSPSRPALAS